MRSTPSDWEYESAYWLKPFLERLGHKARPPLMCPLYVTGLIPWTRRSQERSANGIVARGPGDHD